MKKSTPNTHAINENDISFDEIDGSWVSLNMGGEKFVMDLDTLVDLSYRCASFMSYLESKQEASSEDSLSADESSLCCLHKGALH